MEKELESCFIFLAMILFFLLNLFIVKGEEEYTQTIYNVTGTAGGFDKETFSKYTIIPTLYGDEKVDVTETVGYSPSEIEYIKSELQRTYSEQGVLGSISRILRISPVAITSFEAMKQFVSTGKTDIGKVWEDVSKQDIYTIRRHGLVPQIILTSVIYGMLIISLVMLYKRRKKDKV